MISVLGYELGRAKELLEAEGYSVRCVETRSRKGLNGNEKRVIGSVLMAMRLSSYGPCSKQTANMGDSG